MKGDEAEKKLVIFGGTFDPIHHGHLILANEIRENLKIANLYFLLTGIPPHKPIESISTLNHRISMLRLALQDQTGFEISDLEIKNPDISFTIDTVRSFKDRYFDNNIYIIIGMDSLLNMRNWKEPEKLIDLCRIIVAGRPNYDPADVDLQFKNKIDFLRTSQIEISSSDIRRRVREGRSIKYLVTPAVEQYIIDHNLYRS